MADTKVSNFPPSAGLVLTDVFPVVDDPGGTPAAQKATFTQLASLLGTGNFVLKTGDSMSGALNISVADQTALWVSTENNTVGLPTLIVEPIWSFAGATTAMKVNPFDAGSAAGSLLLDLSVNDASQWSCDKTGIVTQTGSLNLPAAGILTDGSAFFASALFVISAAGTLSSYSGDALAGNGIPAIVGYDSQTVTDVSIPPTLLYPFGVPVTGMYEVTAALLVTAASGAGSVDVIMSWEDEIGATSETIITRTLTTVGRAHGDTVFSVAAGATLFYQATVTGLVGSATYIVKISLKRIS